MAFYTIFKRDLINIILNPVLLLYNTLFPLLLILALGYLTSNRYGAGGVTAYDYYGITIMIFFLLNVSITSANSFMEQSLKNSNLRIIYAPINPSYIFLAKIAATFVFASGCLLFLTYLLHTILGINFGGGNIVYVIFIFILFNLLSSVIGVLFCCIFKSEELSNKILSIANNIFAILGGLFFSLDGLGKFAERLSYLSPVKWVVEGVFKIIYDNDLSYFWPVVLFCLGGAVLLTIACKFSFKVEDYV